MVWLTREQFQNGHYEIGSGTCLQPLLRFSDRFDQFLFIDFELRPDMVVDHLQRAVKRLAADAARLGVACPLVLDNTEICDHLDEDDLELVASPERVMAIAAAHLGERMADFKPFIRPVREDRPQQWGVCCQFTRILEHVDGSLEHRALTLRILGGEGILAYIALGGLEAPPRVVSTIQTGFGERHDGPLAWLFRRQLEKGGPLPEVWIRGQERKPVYDHFRSYRPLIPVGPYETKGQAFAGWVSDREFPYTADLGREVAAWISAAPDHGSLRLGRHTFSPTQLGAEAVAQVDTACLSPRLADTLGVLSSPKVTVAPQSSCDLMFPLARQLRRWSASPGLSSAKHAVLVCSGYEDEFSVLMRFLSTLEGPEVTVHLPMPLDFAAAQRAVDAFQGTRSLQ